MSSTRDSSYPDLEIPLNAGNLLEILRICMNDYDLTFHEYVEQLIEVHTEMMGSTTEESDVAYQLRREAFENCMNTIRDNTTHNMLRQILEASGHPSDHVEQPALPTLPRLSAVRRETLTLEPLEVNSIATQVNHLAEQMNNLARSNLSIPPPLPRDRRIQLILEDSEVNGVTAQTDLSNEQMTFLIKLQDLTEEIRYNIRRLLMMLAEIMGLHQGEDASPRPIDFAALPKIIVDEAMLAGDITACVICLNDLQLHDEVTKLPCKHMAWHSACIAVWVEQHGRCPYCRAEIARD